MSEDATEPPGAAAPPSVSAAPEQPEAYRLGRLPEPLAPPERDRLDRALAYAQRGWEIGIAPVVFLLVDQLALPYFPTPVAIFLALVLAGVAAISAPLAAAALGAFVLPGFVLWTGIGKEWIAIYALFLLAASVYAWRARAGPTAFALTLATVALTTTPAFPLAPLTLAAAGALNRNFRVAPAAIAIGLLFVLHMVLSGATWIAWNPAPDAPAPSTPLIGPMLHANETYLASSYAPPGRPVELAAAFVTNVGTQDPAISAYLGTTYYPALHAIFVVILFAGTYVTASLVGTYVSVLPDRGSFKPRRMLGVGAPVAAGGVFAFLVVLLLGGLVDFMPPSQRTLVLLALPGAGLAFMGALAGASYSESQRRHAIEQQALIETLALQIDERIQRVDEEFAAMRHLMPELELNEQVKDIEIARHELRHDCAPERSLSVREATARLRRLEALLPRIETDWSTSVSRFRVATSRFLEHINDLETDLVPLGLAGDEDQVARHRAVDPSKLELPELRAHVLASRELIRAQVEPIGELARHVEAQIVARLAPNFPVSIVSLRDSEQAGPERALRAYLDYLKLCDERFLVDLQNLEEVTYRAGLLLVHANDNVRSVIGAQLPAGELALLDAAVAQAVAVARVVEDPTIVYPLRHVHELRARPTLPPQHDIAIGLARLRLILKITKTTAMDRARTPSSAQLANAFHALPDVRVWRASVDAQIAMLPEEGGRAGLVRFLQQSSEELRNEVDGLAMVIESQQAEVSYQVVESAIRRVVMRRGSLQHHDLPVKSSVRTTYLERFAEENPGLVTYDAMAGLRRRNA